MFDEKYFPLNIDSGKLMVFKIDVDSYYCIYVDLKSFNQNEYYIQNTAIDYEPLGVFDHDKYFVVVCHGSTGSIKIIKCFKDNSLVYDKEFFPGEVESLSAFKVNREIFISLQTTKGSLIRLDAETLSYDYVFKSQEHFVTKITDNEADTFIAQCVDITTGKCFSLIYDLKWSIVDKVNINIGSDDLCCYYDHSTGDRIVNTNVQGSDQIFFQKSGTFSGIDLGTNPVYEIEGYISDDQTLLLSFSEQERTGLWGYNLSTSELFNIIDNCIVQKVYIDKKSLVVISNSVYSPINLSVHSFNNFRVLREMNIGPKHEIKLDVKKHFSSNAADSFSYYEYSVGKKTDELVAAVYLHGGPKIHWTPTYNELFYRLADAGVKVFYPNYYTTLQKDRKMVNSEKSKWGQQDFWDVLEFRRSMNFEKVILIGESYGGYLALKLWNHCPYLWDGLITFASFYNPWSLYLDSSEVVKKTIENNIYHDDKGMSDLIPSNINHKINTEVLLMHGAEDKSIPFSQTEKIGKYMTDNYEWEIMPRVKIFSGMGHMETKVESISLINKSIFDAVINIINRP